jgi:hypothetical protein
MGFVTWKEQPQFAVFIKWLSLPSNISSYWGADTDQITTILIMPFYRLFTFQGHFTWIERLATTIGLL